MKAPKTLLVLSLVFLFAGCEKRADDRPQSFSLPEDRPDQFLRFLNTQAPLVQGEYTLYVLPNVQGEGSYTGSITLNGTQLSAAGAWPVDVDINWADTSVSGHTIDYRKNSTLDFSFTCSTDCTAFLIKGNYVHLKKVSEENVVSVSLPASYLDSLDYANAYYAAVDPTNERTTLDDFKTKNGFDNGFDTHVIFRDSKDLGYGRDMYTKFFEDGRIALYVNNFVVSQGAGNPANYGPINLVAATDQNFDFHLGSNAIEFTPIEDSDGNSDADADYILKFFTYSGMDENGIQHRLTAANLDGRGTKHMPTTCLVCHGARMLPLNTDGSFNTLSLTSAKLNQFEVDSFEFLAEGTFSQTQQEAAIRLMNQGVHDVFTTLASRDATTPGYWDATFAQDIAAGRYTDDTFSSETYLAEYIPEGWQQTAFRPEGVETLYQQVVEPHCISCHSIRGFNAGNDEDLDEASINGQVTKTGTAINFSNYEKFIGYADIITDYVFRRGAMPLSLRNYEKFWQFPDGAPALLASFLPGFNLASSDGQVLEPGLPVAKPGRDRIAKSPVLLNGGASYFANTFEWSIIAQPEGAVASLENNETAVATLIADTDGEYELQLAVSNSRSDFETATTTITIDSQLAKHNSELNFVDDIQPILQTTLFELRTCQSCHFSGSDIEGVPVYYDSTNPSLYEDVRARVDFNDADNSILIRKPTRLQHGGGLRIDLSTQEGKSIYSKLIGWILHGAPCGIDTGVCSNY